jgi:hypothetical protein
MLETKAIRAATAHLNSKLKSKEIRRDNQSMMLIAIMSSLTNK